MKKEKKGSSGNQWSRNRRRESKLDRKNYCLRSWLELKQVYWYPRQPLTELEKGRERDREKRNLGVGHVRILHIHVLMAELPVFRSAHFVSKYLKCTRIQHVKTSVLIRYSAITDKGFSGNCLVFAQLSFCPIVSVEGFNILRSFKLILIYYYCHKWTAIASRYLSRITNKMDDIEHTLQWHSKWSVHLNWMRFQFWYIIKCKNLFIYFIFFI